MTKDSATIYAGSLYGLACEEGLSAAIFEDLELVEALVRETPDYLKLLTAPSIPMEKRIAMIDEAFLGKLQPYTLNFMKILTESSMISELPSCIKNYRERYYRDNGIVEVQVTSAMALSEAQRTLLMEKLRKTSGKQVIVKEKTDPGLIAGLRVEMEGRLYELTAAGRLQAMKGLISQTVL